MQEDPRSPAERVVDHSAEGIPRVGRLSTASFQRQRTLEAYLRAGVLPRFMERLREIEDLTRRHRRELSAEYADLAERHAGEPAAFAAAWRERADRPRRFNEVNRLIEQHNAWYPIERQLPMDPRTGEYVPIAGRPYHREPLDDAWILREFPIPSGSNQPG